MVIVDRLRYLRVIKLKVHYEVDIQWEGMDTVAAACDPIWPHSIGNKQKSNIIKRKNRVTCTTCRNTGIFKHGERIGEKIHWLTRRGFRNAEIACGILFVFMGVEDKDKVNCRNCKRTKVFNAA